MFFFHFKFSLFSLILLILSELIDLDHLFSKPIYHPKRDPFKTHFLHKNWKFVLTIGIFCLLFQKIFFLGFGLISHIFLDYVYTKYWLKL